MDEHGAQDKLTLDSKSDTRTEEVLTCRNLCLGPYSPLGTAGKVLRSTVERLAPVKSILLVKELLTFANSILSSKFVQN